MFYENRKDGKHEENKKNISYALNIIDGYICDERGGVVKAEEKPYITNPSFENAINKSNVQLYKAVRTSEKSYDGKYSIKVGNYKPENEHEVPIWSYNYGKGSVNVVIDNVKPNTTYEVTTHYFNDTGVKMSTGVLDVDGSYSADYPWKLASNIKTNNQKSTSWQTNVHTIKTGPRTDQIYAFAYMEWTGNEKGAGVFYFDDVEIKELETNAKDITTIAYEEKTDGFPNTVPAVQNFEQTKGTFKLTKRNQVFSTDQYSKAKTEYLAKSMKEKGLIDKYTIRAIDDVKDAKGITLIKKPIQFKLSDTIQKQKCKKDTYQIDITEDKVMIYSDYIEGIQNGSMTILQAFTQRDSLNCGTVEDYTDQNVRGLQVDSGRRYYSIDWLKNQIEQMAYYKQNVLQLRLKDNEGIRFDSKVAPELVDRKGGFWTQSEIDELVNHAKKFNINVIPEVDFPGHSGQEADYHSDWKITKVCSNLDFSKAEVREYIFSIYQEAADMFHADTIHIGGDEYFQTSGWNQDITGEQKLTAWAQEVTGNPKADHNDALKLFFNEAAKPFLEKGINVLVWNDNMFSFNSAVDLDKRITIDFWAGSIYGSIIASDAIKAGYNVMSSSASNYHDLWPQQNQDKLDRPAPKNLYENFTRYTYSKAAFNYPFYNRDEILTEGLDQAQGQVFPIWDDAHGYVPEYVLSRTLFPRYAGFAYKTWGAEYENKLTYDEFERLAYAVESPRPDLLGKQVEKNYTALDYKTIVQTIKDGLAKIKTENPIIQNNIKELSQLLNQKIDKTLYTVEEVENLIRKYENVEYVADTGKVTIQYVDENNKDLCDPIIIQDEVGKDYVTEAKEFEGYTLKQIPNNAKGMIERDDQIVVYVYQKNQTPVDPDKPNEGDQTTPTPVDPNKPSGGNQTQGTDTVKTSDETTILTTVTVALIALGGIYLTLRTQKRKMNS